MPDVCPVTYAVAAVCHEPGRIWTIVSNDGWATRHVLTAAGMCTTWEGFAMVQRYLTSSPWSVEKMLALSDPVPWEDGAPVQPGEEMPDD
jgi:hypothetical protein